MCKRNMALCNFWLTLYLGSYSTADMYTLPLLVQLNTRVLLLENSINQHHQTLNSPRQLCGGPAAQQLAWSRGFTPQPHETNTLSRTGVLTRQLRLHNHEKKQAMGYIGETPSKQTMSRMIA